MIDIAALKKSRESDLSRLKSHVNEERAPKTNPFEDNRFWKPERDKLGNAIATIRFLYQLEGEMPYIKYLAYSFKGPTGRFYVENSLVTFKQPDPVYEMNGRLYKSGIETDKLIAKNQRLNTKYISNILMVNDPTHPENNGKVFLLRYGPEIHKMIINKISPEYEDDEALNVFDYWDGANFKLRLKNGDKNMPTYSSSTWDKPSAIGTDEYIQKIAEQQYPLTEFLSEKHFKPYDVLKKRLDWVYAQEEPMGSAIGELNKTIAAKSPPSKPPVNTLPADTDDENYEEYFNSLLAE
jgi:hypothetical protein